MPPKAKLTKDTSTANLGFEATAPRGCASLQSTATLRRLKLATIANPKSRQEELEQFLTATPVADFMASMFGPRTRVVLTNLESLNSVLIRQGLPQPERLLKLNEIAITQTNPSPIKAEHKHTDLCVNK